MLSSLLSRWSVAAVVLLALLGLSPVPAKAADEAPAQRLDDSCGWTEPNGNTAYPETHARYFRLALPRNNRTRGLRLRIDGVYLASRYFSYQLYGGAFDAIDALADYQIQPNPGSQSPLAGITRIDPAVRAGGQYTVYVVFADKPARPAPNTLYAGDLRLPWGRNYLFLRAYLSAGRVPLPRIRYQQDDGSPAPDGLFDGSACNDSAPPASLNNGGPDGNKGNEAPAAGAKDAPAGAGLLAGSTGGDIRFEVYQPRQALGGGVVYNQNAGFMSARIERRDELVLVRFRAPSVPGRRGAVVPDVRYWSLCQNRHLLQTVIACVADRDAAIDASGYFHAVIGDLAGRPLGADAQHGFSYLPSAGLLDNGLLIVRQLLAHPDFPGAINAVPADADPQTVLGDYNPQATRCPRALFSARIRAGDRAAQIFAACRAAR